MSEPLSADDVLQVAEHFGELDRRVLGQFDAESVPADDVVLARTITVRYRLQVRTIDVGLRDGDLVDADTANRLIERFGARYSEIYGAGALLAGGAVETEMHRVVGTRPLTPIAFPPQPAGAVDAVGAILGDRRAYFEPHGFADVPVYDGGRLTNGNVFNGPAIVQRAGDSVIVPPGFCA
jgi:N-methylhydantoinase A/oxoprolinase/acetone carboxylase beta subunit